MRMSWLFLTFYQLIIQAHASDTDSACLREKEFECGNGSIKCIPVEWKCDNTPDCEHGTDELNCTAHKCPSGKFECDKYGMCLPGDRKCDGYTACEDGYDERRCYYKAQLINTTAPVDTSCQDGFFKCFSKNVCIANSHLCDGDPTCEDGSDELNCGSKAFSKSVLERHENHIRPCREDGMFVCRPEHGKLGVCVPMSSMCNGIKECPLGDDESEKCSECAHTKCDHICENTARGALCSCKKGYKLAEDGRSCEEEDHCQLHGEQCQHFCKNGEGSFVCICADGYYLEENGLSCNYNKTAYPEGYMLLSGHSHGVRQISLEEPLDPSRYDLIYKSGREPGTTHIDYLYRENKLYVAYNSKRYKNDNEELRVLQDDKLSVLRENLVGIDGVAVDWITGNVYLLQGSRLLGNPQFGISVCTSDGKFCRRIRGKRNSTIFDRLKCIIVHPLRGLLIWIESVTSNLPEIVMANMDGSNIQVLADHNTLDSGCKGLAVDYIRNDLYYETDHENIERINIDTRKRTSVNAQRSVNKEGKMLYFNGYLYWLDFDNLKVKDVYHNTSSPTITLDSLGPRYLTVNHSLYQSEIASNPCSNFKCPWICVLAPDIMKNLAAKCVCPDGYKEASLGEGLGTTCVPPSTDEELRNLQIDSQIGLELMSEYCQSGLGCLNGGVCRSMPAGIICDCPEHYDGLYCERLIPGKTEGGGAGTVLLILVGVFLFSLILGFFAYFWIFKGRRSLDVPPNGQH